MNLFKQAQEEARRDRLSGPVDDAIVRVQRIDVGKFGQIKEEIKAQVMQVVDDELDKVIGKVDGKITDFAELISTLNIRIRNAVRETGATYSVSNSTTRRTIDANDTSLNELADLVGTLIQDLITSRIIKSA